MVTQGSRVCSLNTIFRSRENLRETLRPEKNQYPSLLDVSRNYMWFEITMKQRNYAPKSIISCTKSQSPIAGSSARHGVPGLPDIEYPSTLQLDFGEPAFIPTPNTQATASSSSCPTSRIGAPPGLEPMLDEGRLTNSCPASIVEFLPGLEDEALPFVIPKMQAVVPPPPVAPPVLPGSLQFEQAKAMDPPADSVEPREPLGLPAYVDFTSMCVSLGSAGHGLGTCKPCAFFHTKGCSSGKNCTFCHLCPPGEKKRRAKIIKMAAKLGTLQGAEQGEQSPLPETLLPAQLFEEALKA